MPRTHASHLEASTRTCTRSRALAASCLDLPTRSRWATSSTSTPGGQRAAPTSRSSCRGGCSRPTRLGRLDCADGCARAAASSSSTPTTTGSSDTGARTTVRCCRSRARPSLCRGEDGAHWSPSGNHRGHDAFDAFLFGIEPDTLELRPRAGVSVSDTGLERTRLQPMRNPACGRGLCAWQCGR